MFVLVEESGRRTSGTGALGRDGFLEPFISGTRAEEDIEYCFWRYKNTPRIIWHIRKSESAPCSGTKNTTTERVPAATLLDMAAPPPSYSYCTYRKTIISPLRPRCSYNLWRLLLCLRTSRDGKPTGSCDIFLYTDNRWPFPQYCSEFPEHFIVH